MTVKIEDYTVGGLAYIDWFRCGLIPCKTLAVRECTDSITHTTRRLIKVQVTAARPGFKRGEVIDDLENDKIIPRGRVFTRNHQYRIRSGWRWIEPPMIEYRAWCENSDLLHSVELPENATPRQRQAARDECDAAIREAITRDIAEGQEDTREAYHVQVCIGDQDMTGHELTTTGEF